MESFFSSLKTERTARKTYRTRDEARADVFDYIERFYNPKRRHSTIGYRSPMEFESQVGLALPLKSGCGCDASFARADRDWLACRPWLWPRGGSRRPAFRRCFWLRQRNDDYRGDATFPIDGKSPALEQSTRRDKPSKIARHMSCY